jgi:hypothetical protein
MRALAKSLGRAPATARKGFTEAHLAQIAAWHEEVRGKLEARTVTTFFAQYGFCMRVSEVAALRLGEQ